jgi:hypothetical protein
MTKYHINWRMNLKLMPTDPAERIKLQLAMLEMVRADLKSGNIIDWGNNCDMSGGYQVMEGSETELFNNLMKWYPFVQFDAKPVFKADQVKEAINKAVAESKKK